MWEVIVVKLTVYTGNSCGIVSLNFGQNQSTVKIAGPKKARMTGSTTWRMSLNGDEDVVRETWNQLQ